MTTIKKRQVKPLTPDEILKQKNDYIHPDIIAAVNNLLIKEYDGSYTKILMKEIEKEFKRINISSGEKKINVSEAHKLNYFDFEKVFENKGWDVDYEQTCQSETYFEPYYTFSKKKRKD